MLRISADQAAGLVDALLHLYQAKAESLQQTTNDLIRRDGSSEAVLRARDELRAIDQAIDQLGWDPGRPKRAVEITAERGPLREAVAAAIDEAGTQLSARCTELLRGEGSAAAIDTGIEELRALLTLLRNAEGAR
jgi:hypothetical protein